jgi:cation transporter-like permease
MADEDKELPELKALYDELWSDARTMIKDMKKSIFVYLFTGFITLAFSAIMIGTAISDWNKILSGGASTLTYFYAIAGTLGTVFYVPFGVALVYWHNKLKNRYSKLIKIEKELED